ncbi:MAG: sulfate ABC transporter substrate-binding protein [Opitutaceae bacterium]|jgi:sulfate transport system substrate-binding protein|nr:sulfate ABC transporter substrate-binding protein [Opitutaceae bacterium]
MKPSHARASKSLPALLAALAALLAPGRAPASPCCAGVGSFGLDARWQNSGTAAPGEEKIVSVLNASTATTRDFFAEINSIFGKAWVAKTDYSLALNSSHGPAFTHTRLLASGGEEADIVTLDNPAAIDELSAAGLLPAGWRARLPNNSTPFTSTLVFLVRKGNPLAVRDWADLARPGVRGILPDPRDSSVGQWVYLSAWALALERAGGDTEKARAEVAALYRNAVSLHSSASGAAGAFVEKGAGDVTVLLESEALARRAAGELPASLFEIVTPPASLRVETPVAWLDKNVGKHENARVSASLLIYLFTPEAQEIAARHHLRPVNAGVAARTAANFAPVRLLTLDSAFGGWDAARKRFFGKGGELERDYASLASRDLDLAPRLPSRRRAPSAVQ